MSIFNELTKLKNAKFGILLHDLNSLQALKCQLDEAIADLSDLSPLNKNVHLKENWQNILWYPNNNNKPSL